MADKVKVKYCLRTGMKIRAVLDEKYYEEVPTVKVFAGVLGTLQHVSRAIKTLNELLPVPSLQHLKRVKRSDGKAYVILDLVPETGEIPSKRMRLGEEAILSELRGKGFLPEEYELVGVEMHDVPASAPLTRVQYEKSMKYWPVNFHPVKKLETLMSDTIFDASEEAFHLNNMNTVVEEAKITGKNVALVVDFDKRQPVAKGIDRLEAHPLQHAVMVAVDAVASIHRGGAWDLPFPDLALVKSCEPGKATDLDLCAGEEVMGPYLCTGYDLYVYKEPCVMCAMSLVHSRVKRIFFRVVNPRRGALASKCQIQSIKDLNHHYGVFQIGD